MRFLSLDHSSDGHFDPELRDGIQVAHHQGMFLSHIWITFVLATIGFAGNARYTEMIWTDLRDIPSGPTAQILDERNHWIN